MCTILWRCKLKPPQSGNLKSQKKRFILKHSTHDLQDRFEYERTLGKCEGQKQY